MTAYTAFSAVLAFADSIPPAATYDPLALVLATNCHVAHVSRRSLHRDVLLHVRSWPGIEEVVHPLPGGAFRSPVRRRHGGDHLSVGAGPGRERRGGMHR